MPSSCSTEPEFGVWRKIFIYLPPQSSLGYSPEEGGKGAEDAWQSVRRFSSNFKLLSKVWKSSPGPAVPGGWNRQTDRICLPEGLWDLMAIEKSFWRTASFSVIILFQQMWDWSVWKWRKFSYMFHRPTRRFGEFGSWLEICITMSFNFVFLRCCFSDI